MVTTDKAVETEHAPSLKAENEMLREALKAVRPLVEADARRLIALAGNDEESEGKYEGAMALLMQVDDAIAETTGGV